MRIFTFNATFVLHFLFCIISSAYFAFPTLWLYSKGLQLPLSPNPKNYIMHFLFCDRIQKDCSPLSAACINDLPAWAKSLVSLPRPLRLCAIFTSSSIWNFYIFFNWNKSVISQGFSLSLCAVDLQLLTAVWYKSNKLFLNPANLPNSTKSQ